MIRIDGKLSQMEQTLRKDGKSRRRHARMCV